MSTTWTDHRSAPAGPAWHTAPCAFRILLLLMLAVATATAGPRILETKTHREVWNTKDVEWTAAPRIEAAGDNWSIQMGVTAVRHRDGFSGVTGEMNFMTIDQIVRTVVVVYADRTEHTVPKRVWNFEGIAVPKKPINRLRLECEVVGRKWNLEWVVERVLAPDEIVLEFFDPATGRTLTSAPFGQPVALRLLMAPENERGAALFFTAEVETALFPQGALWLLEKGPEAGVSLQYVSEPRTSRPAGAAEGEAPGTATLVFPAEEGDRLTARAEGTEAALAIESEPVEVLAVRFLVQDADGLWTGTRQLPAAPVPFRVEAEFAHKPPPSQRTIDLLTLPEGTEFDPALLSELPADGEEIPAQHVALSGMTGEETRWQSSDLHLAAADSTPAGQDAIRANPEDLVLAYIGEIHALAAAGTRGEASVTLAADAVERQPGDKTPVVVTARLESQGEALDVPGNMSFTFAPDSESGATVEVPLGIDMVGTAVLSLAWEPAEEVWTGSVDGETLLELAPGMYQVTATAELDSPGIAVKPGAPLKLTLHPPPLLVVYEPTRTNTGLALERRPQVQHVIHDQVFKAGVVLSPYGSTAHPDEVAVKLTSSVESIEEKIPRVESGGAGLGVYDMRGNTFVTYHTGRPQRWPELVTKPLGETITVAYGDTTRSIEVSRDDYTREAKEIREVLRDYQAIFSGLLGRKLAPELRQEVQFKADLMSRALTYHEFLGTMSTLKLIEISGGYLEMIQRGPATWGRREAGYLPDGFIPGGPAVVPYGWTGEASMLRARCQLADARVITGTFDVLESLLSGAGTLPYAIIKSIPEMLASPVYSGYTLLSGRQLDGEWASGQQKVFAGVEVALTLIPMSVSVLKTARPDLYERALTRLRLVKDLPPTRILPDEALSGPRWPELAERIGKAERAIGTHETTIARVREALARLPEERSAGRARVNEIRAELTAFDAEAPSVTRMENTRKRIRARESAYRRLAQPTAEEAADYRAFMKDEMAKLDKDREVFVRQQQGIAKRLQDAEQELRKLEVEGTRLRQSLAKAEGNIRKQRAKIEKWRTQTARRTPPVVARARSQASKLQGNRGELVAFEALSRDGFIRHVERNGRMPNRLENWREVQSCLQVFEKAPDDLAARLGMDPDELQLLMQSDNVPDTAMLAKARDAFSEWSTQGVPYWPTGSVGPDGIYWNPKTNRLRVVEVKTGSSELGQTQLTNRGIETWIKRMKGRGNRMYRPGLAEALTQAVRSGELERCLMRVDGDRIVDVKLLQEVGGELVEIPIAGRRG